MSGKPLDIRGGERSAPAPVDLAQDDQTEVERANDIVKQDCEPRQIFRRQRFEFHEIANIDGIRPEELAKSAVLVVADEHRLEAARSEAVEGVEDKARGAQGAIDVGKQRLTHIKGHEFDLGLNQRGRRQSLGGTREDAELRALNVDLDEIDVADVFDVVEPAGFDREGFLRVVNSWRFWNFSSRARFGG